MNYIIIEHFQAYVFTKSEFRSSKQFCQYGAINLNIEHNSANFVLCFFLYYVALKIVLAGLWSNYIR